MKKGKRMKVNLDLLARFSETERRIGEHGVVKLIDCMPRIVLAETDGSIPSDIAPIAKHETWDHAILQAARVSYGADQKESTPEADRGLIRYLWSHEHGTPFEMVDLKFYIALPIFVARQFIRHRMASVNEYSMRYKEPKDEFFIPVPEEVRKQSTNNKQGSEGQIDEEHAGMFCKRTEVVAGDAMDLYNLHKGWGIGKELARINLPLTTFTYWYWEIDLRNFLGFLKLRMDKHAQKELRDYANAMYAITQPLAPWTFEAFDDFTREAVRLSKLEIEAISRRDEKLSERATKREQEAYAEKLKLLNFDFLLTNKKES
jgi:thymidylate synthase (FAD)